MTENGRQVDKAQARAKVLDLLDMPPRAVEEDAKGRSIAHNNQITDPNIALEKQYENWKEFKPGKKYITVIPYLEMESQIILLLIIIASLGKSQKCCVSYLGNKKLILMFFMGSSQISLLHKNIQGSSWKENRGPPRETHKVNQIQHCPGKRIN